MQSTHIRSRRFKIDILNNKQQLGYVLILPAVIVLTVALIVPLLYSLYLSFFKWNLKTGIDPVFNGFSNFVKVFKDPSTWNSIYATGVFSTVSVVLEISLGLFIALILNRINRGVRFVRTILIIPMMVSEIVAALSWKFIFDPDFGILNFFFKLMGLPQQTWTGADLAMASLIIVEIWQHTPFVILILLAGLQSISMDVMESAQIDGAGFWSKLIHVTIPLLNPQLMVALIFRTMFTMRVFTAPWVLTGGGPADKTMVLGINIYRKAFRYYDMGDASAISWMLVVISMIITYLYLKLLSREGTNQ